MRVRAERHIIYHAPDGRLVEVQRGEVADVPEAVVMAHPSWFAPLDEEPARKDTQVKRGEAKTG